jgi:hypothetical protein
MTEPQGIHQNSSPDEQECFDFQAQMPERIAAGEDLQDHPHMLTCERCRSLVSDLEYIAQAAREYMGAEAEPNEDLWSKIQSAIEHSGSSDSHESSEPLLLEQVPEAGLA